MDSNGDGRAVEVRVVQLDADVRQLKADMGEVKADVRYMRDEQQRREERVQRRWDTLLGCATDGSKLLLGDRVVRWGLVVAIVTAIPGATVTYALMRESAPAIVRAVLPDAAARPRPTNTAADTDDAAGDAPPIPPLGG